MNFPNQNESLEDIIARYGPKRSGPYAKLRGQDEFIAQLRRNGASYDTITTILRERYGIEVSDTTVRKFCRNVLHEPPSKRAGKGPAQPPPAATTSQSFPPRPARPTQRGGPQIAQVDFIKDTP